MNCKLSKKRHQIEKLKLIKPKQNIQSKIQALLKKKSETLTPINNMPILSTADQKYKDFNKSNTEIHKKSCGYLKSKANFRKNSPESSKIKPVRSLSANKEKGLDEMNHDNIEIAGW